MNAKQTSPAPTVSSERLLAAYGRAELGIDGNCGYALLGPDLQQGEAEFWEIKQPNTNETLAQCFACRIALQRLRDRLNLPQLSYYFGTSHPYGS